MAYKAWIHPVKYPKILVCQRLKWLSDKFYSELQGDRLTKTAPIITL
jgi:hypothetical protein